MAEPTPSAPSPRHVAESLYAALLRSDREALVAIASPDIRIHVTEDLAYGGDYSGLPGFAALFKNTFDLIESRVEIERFFEAGSDTVVAVGRTRGTGRATGTRFDAAIVHVLTVEDGLLVGFDAFVEDRPITAAIQGTAGQD
ncbi:nuclear transport factor 2 family protein [Streptomyces sp. MC1]|uniref:nuclear transport factor 2 family protein n=1 Tax=Streptomyces sp. MC1 TaxID=295105 RepID=UPI0018CB8FEA|nr:nuclear transport factor 2 family protein [Streptomyces sp. MC1]MBG7698688.1 nuclear transport factor 2 family protein [Streptomyces sp. MC1]